MRRLLTVFFICAATVLLVWSVHLIAPFKALEGHALDWRFFFRGPHGERSSDIVLVLVEEEADLDYRSPIPRRHLAQVIERLDAARLVGMDILLDQPSFDEEGDAHLKAALAANGKVIAVSYIDEGELVEPHAYFRDELLDVGYATFSAGIGAESVRQAYLKRQLVGGGALSFSAALYAHFQGIDVAGLKEDEDARFPGELEIDQNFIINFSGPPNAVYRRSEETLPGGFAVCPSHLVAAGVYPPAFFRGKIALIGPGLSDASDLFRTPFFMEKYEYEKMFGVEVHAHLLQTLLSGAHLRPWRWGWDLLLALGLVLAMIGAVLYLGVFRSFGVALLALVGLWCTAFMLFEKSGVVMPLILPSMAVVFAYGLSTSYYALTEGKEKRQTRQLFEKYLSPEVIKEFMQDSQYWELGGQTLEITVMFADLEGFTPLSEQLSPEAMVHLINQYLTEMSAVVLYEQGTIDKYEGDLIMAFFGAPIPQRDHAARACRAALAMQRRMEELRRQWKAEGLPELRMRIGLHSGPAVVGNMGSDFRFNYTAMGDTVNLASRLEGANKDFGTYTLVSEATREMAGEEFEFRSLGTTQVKGKSEETAVCELLTSQKPL